MQLFRRLRHTVASPLARTRFERDLRHELREHVRRRAEALERTGLSPAEALRRARIEFGALEAYKEQCRDAGGMTPLRPLLGIGSDLKLAARRLAATPLFLLFAVISLALGVGVTTAVYSILYAILWRPLGIAQPSRVAIVASIDQPGALRWQSQLSLPDLADFRERQRSFSDLTAFATIHQTVQLPQGAEIARIETVSGNYFRALGVEALLGRVLVPSDDERRLPALVLSHSAWRQRFASDRAVVGRAVRIGELSFEVIGVTPSTFRGAQVVNQPAPVGWVPLALGPSLAPTSSAAAEPRDRRQLTVLGRLAESSTIATATAELAAIGNTLDASYPIPAFRASNGTSIALRRAWVARDITETLRPTPEVRIDLLLIGMTLMVLLVACTNIANLMLSRGALRLHEIAVRRALGAGRWRLVRELFAESAIITVLGAICTYIVTRLLLTYGMIDVPTQKIQAIEPELNLPALAFASLALFAAAVVFGLEPALNLTRSAVSAHLASEAGAAPLARTRRQRTLIRWQVAISACFFIVTSLLARAILTEARNDSGIALDRLAVTTLHFSMQGWDEARARRTIDRALELARANQDIESASVTTGLPFGLQMSLYADITTPNRPFVRGGANESTLVLAGSPDLLRTLEVPLLRGRAFDYRDDAGSRRVAIVSEFTEGRLFGRDQAIGRDIVLRDAERRTPETYTIVGVAKQTDVGRLMLRQGHLVYIPFAQRYRPNLVLAARTAGDPDRGVRFLQQALRQADPDVALGTSGSAYRLTAGPYVAARIGGILAAALGGLTLVLAMVGLYGVQAHAVAHRTREVGVRMALGAAASDIRRMMLRDGFRPVVEGLVLGLVLGTLVRGLLRAVIAAAPIDVVDPVALLTVPIPLGIAALCACYLPARRASHVDPNVALRHL